MAKSRRERCPQCGAIDVIRWRRQAGHQRYKCKRCGVHFTFRRKDVGLNNMSAWFRWWVKGKQTVEQISSLSGHSVRLLKTVFYKHLERSPRRTIRRGGAVNLLIDGTYFSNRVCLVVYRSCHTKSKLYYRLTDRESFKVGERWFKPNYHAHIVFDWMNHDTGKSRKFNDEDMTEMQSLASDILLMERGRQRLLRARSIWKGTTSPLRNSRRK